MSANVTARTYENIGRAYIDMASTSTNTPATARGYAQLTWPTTPADAAMILHELARQIPGHIDSVLPKRAPEPVQLDLPENLPVRKLAL